MENYIYIAFNLSGWSWLVVLLVPVVIILVAGKKPSWTFNATNRNVDP